MAHWVQRFCRSFPPFCRGADANTTQFLLRACRISRLFRDLGFEYEGLLQLHSTDQAAIHQELELLCWHTCFHVRFHVQLSVRIEWDYDEVVRRLQYAFPVQSVEPGADALEHFADGSIICRRCLHDCELENQVQLFVEYGIPANYPYTAGI